MPRDSNQVYTLPEAPFVANATALSAQVNNNFSDIATALTGSLTRAETTTYTRTLLDDVNAATARATLGAQAALGFTPPQQGTGTGQLSNAIKVGWTGTRFAVTVDSTNLGNVVFDSNVANSASVVSTATGQAVMTAADAAAARTAIAAEVATNITSGAVGEFRLVNPGSGVAFTLPSGGTWQYFYQTFVVASGIYLFVQGAGTAAGGTVVIGASAGNAFIGWCKRIS